MHELTWTVLAGWRFAGDDFLPFPFGERGSPVPGADHQGMTHVQDEQNSARIRFA
jgi:hypothetical protein